MTLPLDDLPSMALFAHVVRLQSFTEAARHVGLAKSAVSKRVAGLEARLGVTLLRRTTRKLSLTEEGMRFYEHCARMVAAANDAEEAVVEAGREVRGPLRISGPVTFSHLHLARALADFGRQHPGVDVDLVTDDRIVDLVEGGFDAVIRIATLRDSSLFARRLAQDRIVIVGAPSYLDEHGEPESLEDLVHHSCLRYSLVPKSADWTFRAAQGRVTVPVSSRFTANDGTALKEAAVAGAGLAVLPSFMAASDLSAGRLRTVLDRAHKTTIDIHVVHAQRTHVPRRLRALVDFLVKRFARPEWMFRDLPAPPASR